MTLRWGWVYAACLGVLLFGMAFFVFTGVYIYFEPRAPAEAVALPVTDQTWRTRSAHRPTHGSKFK